MAMAKDQITQGGKKTEKKQVKAALPAVAPKAALDVAAAVAQKAKQDAAKTMAAKQSGAAILAAAEQVSAKLSAANKVNQAYVDLLKARGQVQQAAKAKKRARGNLDFYSTQIGANNGILAGVVSRQNAEVSSFEKRLDDYNKLPTDTEFRALTEKANQLKDREQRISQLERRARASVNLYNRAARREAETYNQHAQKAQQTRLADQAYRDLISEYQGREEYLSSGAAQYQRELVVESRNQQLAEIDLQLSKIKNDPMGYLRENGIETNGQPASTYLYPEMDRLNMQAYQIKQASGAASMESSAMNDPDFQRFVSEGKKKLEGTLKTIRKNGGDDTFQKDYAAMSQDEQNVYAYLYGKDGNEKRAIQYKSYLQRKLNAKQNDAYIKMIQQAAKEDPVGMGIATTFLQPYAAAKTFGDELVALSRSAEERSLPADPNTPGQRLTHGIQAARQEGIERLPNPVLKTLAQAGYAIADMVPSYVLSMAGFPAASTAYMFATQQAGSYADAAQRGVSVNQAIGFATVDAAVASVLEKSGIDSIGEAVGGAIAQKGESGLLRRIVSAAVQSFVGEGGEEAAEALVQPVYDYVINGSRSAFALSKQQYLAEGKTEAEATRLALGEIGREAIDSFIVGGLAGVGISVPQVAVVGAADKITEHAYDRALYQDAVQNGKEYYAINQLTKGGLARQSGNLDIEQDYKKTPYVQEVLNALQKNQQGKAEYSIDPNFADNITAWDKSGRPAGERFVLGSTGEVLQGLGAIESDIYMNSEKATEILQKHPEMTVNEIKRLPEVLDDPVLILKSRGQNKEGLNTRLVVFGSLKAQNGLPIMSVLDLQPYENGFLVNDMQKLTSAYSKTQNPEGFIKESDILYADRNRAAALLRHAGFMGTGELLRYGSIGSISYEGRNVNITGVPFSDIVKNNNGKNTQYLFAGQNAETADQGALAKAQTMREQGADSETARKETGWFQGMDGKWRFEIDDSQMQLKPVEINKGAAEIREANARFLAAQEELLDRSGMTSKDAADFREYMRTRQNDSEKAKQLYAQLSETSFGAKFRESIAALEHLENAQKKNDFLLGDLLEHPQLYRNYPALARVPVRFEQMSGGELGSFDGEVLRLSTSLLQNQAEMKNTLIHEIQHVVQETENFAGGSNPSYWSEKTGNGYSKKWNDSSMEMMASELYENTAGEIEARDVEHRKEFSPQQRRDTAPDLGDANTVFAEEDVASSRAKQLKKPSQWVDPAELGRRAMKAQFAKTETRRSGIMAGVADAVITQAEALSSAFHTEIVFDRALSAQIEGYYQDGKIHLNAKCESGKAAQIVFGHELTHSLEKTKTYRDFVNFALNQMGNETAVKDAVREKIELYRVNGVELDTAGAVREIVAQFAAEKLFADEQTVRRLAVEKPSLAKRILTWIRETLAKLKNEPEKAALLKAEQLYSRMLREAGNGAAKGKSFSLREFDDGVRFVEVDTDQHLFDGLTEQEKTKLAVKLIKERFSGKVIGQDNPVFVNGRSAEEFAHPIKNLTSEVRNSKMRASAELDNLMDAGRNRRTAPDGLDGHSHKNAVRNFEYFDVTFKVGGEYYEGVINIQNTVKGRLLKDITKIRNVTQDICSSYGNNPKSTFLRNASSNSIPTSSENVNGKNGNSQYSISPETEAERLNRRLLKENEELRRQMTLTEHPMPSPAKLRATAKAILKGYSSKYNVNELYTGMEQICENIQTRSQTIGGVQVDYSFEDAQAAALSLAGEVIANSTLKNMNEDYKPLRDLVRNTKIAVPQEIREDLGDPYSEFKATHRELYLAKEGTSIEDLWSVLSEEYPALFDSSKTSNPADMLVHLADVMESTREFEYNPVESGEIDFETETRALANDILERCYSVPNRAPTFADKQAMKLAKEQQKAEEKINRLIDKNRRLTQEVLRQSELKKEAQKVVKAQQDVQEQLDHIMLRNRELTQDVLRQSELKKEARKYADQKERVAQRYKTELEREKEKQRRKREGEALREIRRETLKTLQWLSKNRRKAPADLRDKFDDVLADIDLYAITLANSAHWSEKHQATWKDLAEIYETAKANDPNFLPSQELEKVMVRLNNPKIGEMDLNALQDLYRAAVCLQTEFYDRNKLLGMERDMEIDQTARKSVEEMKEAKGKKTITKKQEFLNEQQLTPMNYLLRMAGWNRNSDFYKMAQQLERGERQMKDYEVRAKRMLDDYIKKHKKWLEKADGQGRDGIWYQVEVPELQKLNMGDKPIFGKMVTVYMTPMQKVHLYLESQNYDNLRHMTGGRTFADKELYAKGQREKAFAEGTTVRLAPETVKRLVSDLTEEEMGLARALKPYYQDFAAKRINEVSNLLYGYDKAMTKDYAPIYTNSNYNKGDFGVYNITAEGVGNMKERIYGVNPSLNIGALDAFERHVRQTSRFVGMAVPARNWTSLMNWRSGNSSFKAEIAKRWGLEAKKYIEDLVTDLQGGTIGDKGFLEKLGDKVLSNYVSGTFGANPSIVLKQAASFPQFAASLGWVNMPKNPIKLIKAAPESLINTYTSELAYRELGYATPETAQLKNNPGLLETNKAMKFIFAGGAITAMDAGTVKRGWIWAENKVKREHPELEIGTKEQIDAGKSPFYQKVAQEFEDAVALTQPMYDKMHRAKIMKNQKGLGKALTMFRTVPVQMYNLLRRNFGELEFANSDYKKASASGNAVAIQKAKEKKKKAARAAAGSISSLLISNLLLEGIEFLTQLWRNGAKKYRDEEGEITAESFLKQFGKGYLSDIAGTVIGGKELTEFLYNVIMGEKWSGIQIPGGEQLNDLLESVQDITKTIEKFVADGINLAKNKGDLGEYFRKNGADYAGAVKKIVQKIAVYGFGFPAENLEKYVMGTIRSISPELAVAAEGILAAPEKSELDDLHGGALEKKIQNIFQNRGLKLSDEAAEELYILYEDGYRDSVPGDAPKTITVNDESRELTATQAQKYDKAWKETISDSINELTKREDFQACEQEDQERMLQKIYDHAKGIAKKAAFPETELDKATEKANTLIKAFDSTAAWAAWEVKTANRTSSEKRDLLRGLKLTDTQKREVYEIDLSNKQGELIDALKNAGFGFDEFLKLQNQKASFKGETAKLEFSHWLDKNYSEEQADQIRGAFYKTELRYDKLTDAGMSEDAAYSLHTELAALEPEQGKEDVSKRQQLVYTAFSRDYNDEEKQAALSVLMGESFEKLEAAQKEGIPLETFMDFYLNKNVIKADKDENGKSISGKKYGSKQQKIGTYIDSLPGLSDGQKEYLYKTIYETGSNLDLTPWHGGTRYEGELPTNLVEGSKPAQRTAKPSQGSGKPQKENQTGKQTTPQKTGSGSGSSGEKKSGGTGAKTLKLPTVADLLKSYKTSKPSTPMRLSLPTVNLLNRGGERRIQKVSLPSVNQTMADMMRKVIPSPKKITRSDSKKI